MMASALLWLLGVAGALVAVSLILRLIYRLPALDARPVSHAVAASDDTTLGRRFLPHATRHPGLSGIMPLANGFDSFAARVQLIGRAEATIDVQYYTWLADRTGRLLLAELQAAARRGVRIRILVDDGGTLGLDRELTALDAEAHVEVRLFNPYMLRYPRPVNYLFDLARLNRRMHNKCLIVDGVASVIGGRNIGDRYFQADEDHDFIDLDVLAVGQAAADAAAVFDTYWQCASSHPVGNIIADHAPAPLPERSGDAALMRQAADVGAVNRVLDGDVPLDWVPARLFADNPAKGLGRVRDRDLMYTALIDEIEAVSGSFDIVSAYFIPGPTGSDRLIRYAANGARIRVLTNALESTDVALVHSGYARYRRRLLMAGLELHELRSESRRRRPLRRAGITRISRAALHAKSFSIDRSRVFVGSFNFDPRSKSLNCEMGLMIDDPAIAAGLSDWLDANLSAIAYRVTLDEASHGLRWRGRDKEGAPEIYTVEPNATVPLRVVVWLAGFLPIEWLL